jgi:ribosomal protein S18 acetylase RimI-like enzyme
MTIEIVHADLTNRTHADALVAVLDSYASDPIGGGIPLAEDVKARLIPELTKLPGSLALLAFDGDVAVGLANCFFGFSSFAARPLLNVHDLAVVPGRRERGIGRMLLAEAERAARERGCCRLTLEVQESNERARGLYRSFGFEDLEIGDEPLRTFFLSKPLPD